MDPCFRVHYIITLMLFVYLLTLTYWPLNLFTVIQIENYATEIIEDLR